MNNKLIIRSSGGEILITFLSLGPHITTITYENKLEFLAFMDFYVSKLAGSRELKSWSVKNPGRTLLDNMTANDSACSILCYKNGIDVWMERFKMKQINTEEKQSFMQTATLKYHCPPGTKLKAFQDG